MSNKPTHNVYVVVDTGRPVEGKNYTQKYWNKIGVAWLDADGKMLVDCFAWPSNDSKIEVKPIKEKPE